MLAAARISTPATTGPWHRFDARKWQLNSGVFTDCGLALPWFQVAFAQQGYDLSRDIQCGDCVKGEALRLVSIANSLRDRGWGSDRGGYCRHGRYVGGSGIDWMCGDCEMYGLDEEIAMLRESAADLLRKAVYL